MPGKLFIFSAPSGSGKTTIVQHLLKQNFKLEFSVSATSRSKRANETDGKDYHFLTVEEFKTKIDHDEFLEWEEVYEGCFYGTLKSEVEKIRQEGKNVIFDVDVVGGINIKKFYKEEALAIFIQPPSTEELENRLRNRNTDSDEVIAKRIEKFKFELAFSNQFDKIIVNDELQHAFAEAETTLHDFLNK